MTIAIIIAGGVGNRMGADRPKQFIEVCGRPVLFHTLEAFEHHPLVDEIELVCIRGWEDDVARWKAEFGISKLTGVVPGGASAQESIRNGVFALEGRCAPDDLVVIHDGIRPLVEPKVLNDVIDKAQRFGNGVTSMPYNEQIFLVDPDDPSTWSTVNMHFPFGSKVVSSFDLCQIAYSWNYQRAVKGFAIEGSVDGRRWDVLTNVTLTVATGNTTSRKWAFAKSDYSAGSAGTHAGGAPIAGRPASSVKALSNVSAVSVAKGARLIGENADVEIKGLEVDGRGAGTIENCTFAQTGSIVVKNSKEATGDMLELGFVNCGSPERIANWTAVVDGKTNCKIDYRNGKLYVVRPGFLILVQ